MKRTNKKTDLKTILEYTIKLINKGIAEQAYDGIVLPKSPQKVVKQLETLIKRLYLC